MRESKRIFECIVSDIEGIEGSFHYYATETEVACEDFCSKVYGIRVENKLNGTVKDYIEYIDVTSLYDEIIKLTELMARNKVTTVSAGDIVEDFIS
jgi:hypothetical protein